MSYKPENTSLLSPYMIMNDAGAAIDFYVKAFGAAEKMRLNMPGTDAVMHAEIAIDGSTIMIGQENPACEMVSAKTLGKSPVSLMIYVPDVDAAFARAIEAGAVEMNPPTDMFWGDRMCTVICPFGYAWSLATHQRDPSPEEIEAGAKAMMEQMAAGNG